MRKQQCLSWSRRALLAGSGALVLLAGLRPVRALAQASGEKLRIGVIGSGNIGGTIGRLWVKAGHPVLFSSRHPDRLKDMVAELGPLARSGTVSDAIAFEPTAGAFGCSGTSIWNAACTGFAPSVWIPSW